MSASFTTASSTTSTIATTTTPTLVGEGEVDVRLLLASGALEVDHGLLLLLLVLLLILLLVDRGLLPLGVNVRAFASFPQVELGSLLLGLQLLPFIQGHLLLLLFPSSLSFKFLSGELPWWFWFSFFNGGDFFFTLGVNGCVSLLAFLGHIVLKGSPVTLSAASPLVFSLDSSSVVSGLPVIVPLAPPATALSTSTSGTTSSSFSTTTTSAHLTSAATTSTSSATFTATIVITSVLSVALVVPLFPHLAPRSSLACVNHPLALELAVSLVLFVSFVPGVASISLLHGSCLCHWLRSIFNLLGFCDLLLCLTLLEDVQRIRVLVEEESISICHAYTVDSLCHW